MVFSKKCRVETARPWQKRKRNVISAKSCKAFAYIPIFFFPLAKAGGFFLKSTPGDTCGGADILGPVQGAGQV